MKLRGKSIIASLVLVAGLAHVVPLLNTSAEAASEAESTVSNVAVKNISSGEKIPSIEEEIKTAVDSIDAEAVNGALDEATDEVLKRQQVANSVEVEDDELDEAIQMINGASFIKMDNDGNLHSAMPYSSEAESEEEQTTSGKVFDFILDVAAGLLESATKILNNVLN